MLLQPSVKNALIPLNDALSQLSRDQFTRPCRTLFNATIGQHVRHIIELFLCLENGYTTGIVNYEKRKRDPLIETDHQLARQLLEGIYRGIDRPDKSLLLEGGYDGPSGEPLSVATNYYREVIYNLEHTVHHMALIRVGLAEVSDIEVPLEFGVAASTMKHKKACAQ